MFLYTLLYFAFASGKSKYDELRCNLQENLFQKTLSSEQIHRILQILAEMEIENKEDFIRKHYESIRVNTIELIKELFKRVEFSSQQKTLNMEWRLMIDNLDDVHLFPVYFQRLETALSDSKYREVLNLGQVYLEQCLQMAELEADENLKRQISDYLDKAKQNVANKKIEEETKKRKVGEAKKKWEIFKDRLEQLMITIPWNLELRVAWVDLVAEWERRETVAENYENVAREIDGLEEEFGETQWYRDVKKCVYEELPRRPRIADYLQERQKRFRLLPREGARSSQFYKG